MWPHAVEAQYNCLHTVLSDTQSTKGQRLQDFSVRSAPIYTVEVTLNAAALSVRECGFRARAVESHYRISIFSFKKCEIVFFPPFSSQPIVSFGRVNVRRKHITADIWIDFVPEIRVVAQV